ncbi:hypothetical protein ACFPZI_21835 [Streptomyces chlorus]|uniref:IS607 family transposase n=1 Tax=Streptomyces chlorus TaxID=887452 RepID=A0ABW1E1P1_9ACTN
MSVAARRVGVHPGTLRLWANEGKVPVVWVGKERRFSVEASDVLTGVAGGGGRREALYVRVSGTSGQESSPAALVKRAAAGEFRKRSCGLRPRGWWSRSSEIGPRGCGSRGRGWTGTHVRVTHADRLARFGVGWLIQVLAHHGAEVEVMHAKGAAGGMEELLDDFMSLVATFAGRTYGMRSREARRRLLAEADNRIELPAPAPGTVSRAGGGEV